MQIDVTRGAGGAPGVWSIADERRRARTQGLRVASATDIARAAFTTQTAGVCTVWAYDGDGVLTSTRATADSTASACSTAKAAAVVLGTSDTAARPIVDVIANDEFDVQALQSLVGAEAAQVHRVAGGSQGSFGGAGSGGAAARVEPLTAVVVFVIDQSDADSRSIVLLRAASSALSAAAATAPRAQVVLVGPVGAAGAPSTTQLARDLRTAARVAGATSVGGSTSARSQLRRTADQVTLLLSGGAQSTD